MLVLRSRCGAEVWNHPVNLCGYGCKCEVAEYQPNDPRSWSQFTKDIHHHKGCPVGHAERECPLPPEQPWLFAEAVKRS